jgi:hypothetical protein
LPWQEELQGAQVFTAENIFALTRRAARCAGFNALLFENRSFSLSISLQSSRLRDHSRFLPDLRCFFAALIPMSVELAAKNPTAVQLRF